MQHDPALALRDAERILANMAKGRPGSLFNRWPIHHEPLRADAARALPSIRRAAEEVEECLSYRMTVGPGLVVHGTWEAIQRVQTYIMLESRHPVEMSDVRLTLAKQLQAAERREKALRQALEMVRDADDARWRDGLPVIPLVPRATIDAALAARG